MQQDDLFNKNNFIKNNKSKKINWLSHSAIEELNRCPRCFWLSYNKKIKPPEGIQSRLANRFDNILKKYFNNYRFQNKLPPLIEGKINGKLQKPFKETYFYQFNENYGFYGRLDECLVDGEFHIPIDFKTASSDPREKEVLEAYQNQIDEYLFLMEENGIKTANFGYLIYFFPEMSIELSNGFPMIIHIVKVTRKTKDIKRRIERAIKVLDGPMPEPKDDCPFCRWYKNVEAVLKNY
ncbi:MAG: hypothetical protein ACPL1D_01505 [Microgenomates group bacterium]